MKKNIIALVLMCLFLAGCCTKEAKVNPEYPQNVTGWKTLETERSQSRSTIVLHKGKIITNNGLSIRATALVPSNPCAEAGAFDGQDGVNLQFVRFTDQKILCEDIFVEKGSMTLSASKCGTSLIEYGLVGIYVHAINLKDEWVFIELYE